MSTKAADKPLITIYRERIDNNSNRLLGYRKMG